MYALARRLLFALPPELAHRLTLGGLHGALVLPGGPGLIEKACRPVTRPVELLGQTFSNPIGLAAGFDKNARHVAAMAALGFGFVEVGSVTRRRWAGNPGPRLFRLPGDGALVNRMGLNNDGAEAIARRLGAIPRPIPVFVNVAKTPDPALEGDAAIDDYVRCVQAMAPVADVLVLNISCPNSGDGRTFEDPALLEPLLAAVMGVLGDGPPLLVKISPDLDDAQIDAVARVSLDAGARGLTATNTTVRRDGLVTDGARLEAIGRGGLSGAPLHARAVRCVARLRRFVGPDVPLVGVGGVRDGATAGAFLEAGADLVQMYTGFVYGGPRVVRRICADLAPALDGPGLSDRPARSG